jgi:hypothetical protein
MERIAQNRGAPIVSIREDDSLFSAICKSSTRTLSETGFQAPPKDGGRATVYGVAHAQPLLWASAHAHPGPQEKVPQGDASAPRPQLGEPASAITQESESSQ